MTLQKDKNRRRHRRIEFADTIVMNPMGACEVAEMSSGGFSFQCLFEHSMSDEWTVDILNNSGIYIQKFPVEKVWQTTECEEGVTNICGLAVGVRFKDLTPEQQCTLDELIHLNALNRNSARNSGLLAGVTDNVHFTRYGTTQTR